MNKEQKFYNRLQDVFIGAKIEGEGGFINLMKIKSNYYGKIKSNLKKDIDNALKRFPDFRDELFDKLYNFFDRYFSESGSIYFDSTPFHNDIYEKIYTNDKDIILFWKTQMLYYVKTDRIIRSMPIEFELDKPKKEKSDETITLEFPNKIEKETLKFYFDASTMENKKANEKRNLVYELKEVKEDKTIVLRVIYSEKGRNTKYDDIIKELKKKHIQITDEDLDKHLEYLKNKAK